MESYVQEDGSHTETDELNRSRRELLQATALLSAAGVAGPFASSAVAAGLAPTETEAQEDHSIIAWEAFSRSQQL